MEDPPKKFFRLAPGREVRLRYACFLKLRRRREGRQRGGHRAALHLGPRDPRRGCKLEPSLAQLEPGQSVQLERLGYFCADLDSAPGAVRLNRTITLKDAWAKITARQP
jgi:glutaminyl-tRNA synthetase